MGRKTTAFNRKVLRYDVRHNEFENISHLFVTKLVKNTT